ncbi:MFS transporter [Patulibacter defluvii]|uniref:MFS transporter n=1 Tax=Patulibacter defluvii TaxID=3095358 RepID=UPI002A765DD3|nr:MFS transporter [Patulibacter sp. DM4]
MPRLFGSSVIARMSNGALGLLLILRVRELGGSYGLGGAIAAAFAIGLAGAAPLLGRMVDRRGQTGVLLGTASVAAAVLVAIALLPGRPPALVLIVLAAVGGAALPPVAPCLRALWDVLIPDPARRHAAIALDATSFEAAYVVVPAGLLALGAWSASVALIVAGSAILLGTVLFAATPASRGWRAAARGDHGRLGALASPGVRLLLVVWLLFGAGIGATEVAIAAFAEDHGQKALTGPLLASWGLASMIFGFLAGRWHPADPARRFALLLGVIAVGDALAAAAWSTWSLALLLFLAGAALAPGMTVGYGLLSTVALRGTITEASTWLVAGLGAGLAAGSALGGVAIDAAGPWVSFLIAGAAGAAGASVAAAGAPRLRAAPDGAAGAHAEASPSAAAGGAA